MEANYKNELQSCKEKSPDKDPEDIKKRFGWYAGLALRGKNSVTFSAYKSFITNALPNALTIEELATHNIYLQLSISHWDQPRLLKAGLEIKDPVTILSNSQFLAITFVWQQYYRNLFNPYWLQIGSAFALDLLGIHAATSAPKKKKGQRGRPLLCSGT